MERGLTSLIRRPSSRLCLEWSLQLQARTIQNTEEGFHDDGAASARLLLFQQCSRSCSPGRPCLLQAPVLRQRANDSSR